MYWNRTGENGRGVTHILLKNVKLNGSSINYADVVQINLFVNSDTLKLGPLIMYFCELTLIHDVI